VADVFERIRNLRPGERSPFVDAQLARYDAHVAARRGETGRADERFRGAVALVRELAARFWLAVVLLEHGEWLATQGRWEDAELLLAEARGLFEQLEAAPWLARLDAVAPVARV
jgi:hypothetical protein